MARNMVTRTIISTQVTALCLNLITAEPFNETFTLAGTYKDNAKMKKALEKMYNNDEHIIAHIVHSEVVNTLYGMTEQKFMENAEILPPRKQYNNSEAEA